MKHGTEVHMCPRHSGWSEQQRERGARGTSFSLRQRRAGSLCLLDEGRNFASECGVSLPQRPRESTSPELVCWQMASPSHSYLEVDMNHDAEQHVDSLLRQALSHDREALNELFSFYRNRLYRTLLRLLRNPDDAEEVVQEALFAAFRNLNTFNGQSQFSTWLTRIGINAALMRLRRNRPEVMTSVDQRQAYKGDVSAGRSFPDPAPNPEQMYARKERLEIIEDLLRSLPVQYRKALWLRDVVGLNTREAAEALGLPTGSLKSQLHRARLRLRKEVAELLPRPRVFQGDRSGAARTPSRPSLELTATVKQSAA
jgi:RNA polymerase sigma-70 factor, ECF subfamily